MLKISMRDGATAANLSIPVALEVDKLTKDCKSKLYILTGRNEKNYLRMHSNELSKTDVLVNWHSSASLWGPILLK